MNNNKDVDRIIEALEKQIPINLVCIEDKFLHCPCCDEALSYKWEKYPTEKINLDWLKFCWNCGQALKWEQNFKESKYVLLLAQK